MKSFGATIVSLLAVMAGAASSAADAADTVGLIDAENPTAGWSFGNGPEFPGATGSLDAGAGDDEAGALVLTGDFSQGGGYVQASRKLGDLYPDALRMQVRSPHDDLLTMRIIDASGQCHQIRLRVNQNDAWQNVEFPLRRFFERMGKPGAVPGVVRYEHWGGAKDGRWHGPAKSIHFLRRKRSGVNTPILALRQLTVTQSALPAEKAQRDEPDSLKWVPLLELIEGQSEWNFFKGRELKGSDGSFKLLAAEELPGDEANTLPNGHLLRMTGDFTGPGYVGLSRGLSWVQVRSLEALQLKLRTSTATSFTVRIVDATGQTFQRKNIKLNNDGRWNTYTYDIQKLTTSEAWGGANDRKWHGSPRGIVLMLNHRSGNEGKPTLDIADVRIQVAVGSTVEAPSFKHGFEGAAPTEGWSLTGDVAATDADPAEGERALRLSRGIDQLDQVTRATGPAFAARPGAWDVRAAMRSALESPDNSFRGVLRLQWLDGSGKAVDSVVLADQFGINDWAAVRKRVTAPAQAVTGRFRVEMLKAHGTVDIDALAASFVAAGSHEGKRIDRALIRHERLGNLLYPGDDPTMSIAIEAVRPLPAEQRTVRYTLHDYWGNEQGAARTAALEADGRNKARRFVYRGQLDLSGLPLETGRYYEVRIAVPEADGEAFEDFRSLAVLPEAPAKQHPWQEIPFTSRNWDNRIKDYILLSDRLGLRTVGLRANISAKPPYKAGVAQYKLARELDMGVVLNNEIWKIEHHRKGYQDYTEEVLREGTRNLVEKYAMDGNAIMTLGNEPPLIESRVLEVKEPYRIVYETIKSINPNITVVGTAIGPQDMYLKHGIGAHKDVYDMHTYGDPAAIRKMMDRYETLFEKYGHRKPIWSTELGLNSQGLTRRVVANNMIRKFASFFAKGGENASWFTIYYPDPKAKLHGGSEDSHNTFDGRYRIASPRLDAITYYNMVNGLLDKRFVEEKRYPGDIEAYLFRDDEGRCFQVLYSDRQESDVMLPLEGVGAVTLRSIDGTVSRLDAAGEGVTVRVGPDAILLEYDNGPAKLPDALDPAQITLHAPPSKMIHGGSVVVAVETPGTAAVQAPPGWKVEPMQADGATQRFQVTAPAETSARITPIAVSSSDPEGRVRGLIHMLIPVTGQITAKIMPLPKDMPQGPGVRLTIQNRADTTKDITWSVDVDGEVVMRSGRFKLGAIESPSVRIDASQSGEGGLRIAPQGRAVIDLPMPDVDLTKLYQVRAAVEDDQGQGISQRRWMGGFATAVRADTLISIDGKLDEPGWSVVAPTAVDGDHHFRVIKKAEGVSRTDADDLTGHLRFLWDDQYLYMGIEVTDDVHVSAIPGYPVWRQDGLQFMFAPGRGDPSISGKIDIGLGQTVDGPRAFSYLTADPAQKTGPIDDVKIAIVPNGRGQGGRTYEIALPWSRLSPFKPGLGENIGVTVAFNEDDGPGRSSFLSWFGDVQTKQIDGTADLLLTNEQGDWPAPQ